ncbi:AraC family transcriptional regulator [Algoriphagus pacificus]|uniref:AraC family transcriptional regulator n=1 Tax=Algoriphagus pacificus TaxID=2811234 RepID=A0ABS3CGS6_9BACT|nr:AraC family transcriptional regulator [Algoriphagus pacificus]MBN7816307.1 AraC family transcriptional regulator [Algoriphagus pacificus]
MKPQFHKVPIDAAKSFSLRFDKKPNFGSIWHFHPEIEIHYITKGEGTEYIGDNIRNFSDGDMILLGENLPHTWRCKEAYFQEGTELQVEAYVLHFHPHFLGEQFLKIPESQSLTVLFEKAKQGLIIKGDTKDKVAELLSKLEKDSGFRGLIDLLEILQILGESNEYETISPGYAYSHLTNMTEMYRLDKIYSYVLSNYGSDINLKEVSALANLSTSAFCRYFKNMTSKTFFEFVIEVRISNACRALIENKQSIQMICYECGFNTLSNFYRLFKKTTGMTPFDYRKHYQDQHKL